MNKGKIITLNIILISLIFLASAYLIATKENSKDFVKGVVSERVKSNEQNYYDTLLIQFDPETSWSPNKLVGTFTQPQTQAAGAILVDINSGDILYEKESTKKRPVASLVKIMTAVVALEHKELDEKIFVSKRSASIGENSMELDAGEVYTLEELLYGLILHSGNDSAYAIAEGVAGDSETFVEWMNIKAQELQLRNTKFADPSGLNNSSYSTPEDMAKLTRYALKHPKFREIANTLEKELTGPEHKYIYLYNQTNLLSTYPGVQGVKTGYTAPAGLCLITYANNDGKEVVGVVLGSNDRKGDMILMLDHGYENLGIHIEHDLL